MIVDLVLEIDGMNVSCLADVEKFIDEVSAKCDTIYPVNYEIRYAEV